MTTAEKYRQLEKSPVINIARFIFNDLKGEATNTTLENVIAEIKTGKTPSKQQKRYYEDEYFDWFKPDEIGSEKYLYKSKDKVSKYAFETKQATIYEPDTILINAIGDVGRISILKKQASSNQQITGIRLNSEVYVDYAYFYLLAHREYFYVDLFQTTLPIVNQKKINTIPFCYPIIEEQKRIVKGFEEIEKIKTIDDLQIIDNLNWKEEYKSICRNFFNLQFGTKKIINELTHQLDLIKQLRQAFLREAMQGRFEFPQQPLTEALEGNGLQTGQQLLTKIKAEKAQLIADKKLKKEKELAPISEDEIPFEIPEHWAWCRLGEILNIKSGKRIHASDYRNEGVPFLRSGEIGSLGRGEKIKTELFISQSKYNEVKSKFGIPKNGDILIACIGGSIGNTWIVDEREFYYKDGNLVLIESIPNINYNYLLYYLKSPFFWNNTILNATDSSYNALTILKLNQSEFPLPPIHEQEQIVTKLEGVMAYCDGLEQSIKESQGYNEMLLQQVLREALQGGGHDGLDKII